MPTAEKAQAIDELSQKLRDSKAAVLLDYRGLNVAQISALRQQLRAQEVEFHVAKNTLLQIAAERAEVEVAPELLTGPTAIAFGWRDEVGPAKLLSDFARRNRLVQVKGGILNGGSMNAEQIGRVAELPSRDVLLAQLLGVIQAPIAKALGAIQAPMQELAGLMQALEEKRQSGESAA